MVSSGMGGRIAHSGQSLFRIESCASVGLTSLGVICSQLVLPDPNLTGSLLMLSLPGTSPVGLTRGLAQ